MKSDEIFGLCFPASERTYGWGSVFLHYDFEFNLSPIRYNSFYFISFYSIFASK